MLLRKNERVIKIIMCNYKNKRLYLMKDKKEFITNICCIICILTNLSQIPYFIDNGLTQIISYPIWILAFFIILIYEKGRYLISSEIYFLVCLSIIITVLHLIQNIIFQKKIYRLINVLLLYIICSNYDYRKFKCLLYR